MGEGTETRRKFATPTKCGDGLGCPGTKGEGKRSIITATLGRNWKRQVGQAQVVDSIAAIGSLGGTVVEPDSTKQCTEITSITECANPGKKSGNYLVGSSSVNQWNPLHPIRQDLWLAPGSPPRHHHAGYCHPYQCQYNDARLKPSWESWALGLRWALVLVLTCLGFDPLPRL